MTTEPTIDRESLISQVQVIAKLLGKDQITRREFTGATGITWPKIIKHFESWNELVGAAGLQPINRSRLDDQVLMQSMHDAFLGAGRITGATAFSNLSPHDVKAYTKRWGHWQAVLRAFREWVVVNEPGFPYIDQLPTSTSSASVDLPTAITQSKVVHWERRGGRQYGDFLNFRGLQHAPINEQGVVFLFGMVAHDLGYVVESVTVGFPDCEAKRRTSGKTDTWERVSVEFEFRSKNFLEHGHDPSRCDVIVCWQHDWQDCPIEVLELKSAIRSLEI